MTQGDWEHFKEKVFEQAVRVDKGLITEKEFAIWICGFLGINYPITIKEGEG